MQIVAASSTTQTVGPEDFIDHYSDPFDIKSGLLKLLTQAAAEHGAQGMAEDQGEDIRHDDQHEAEAAESPAAESGVQTPDAADEKPSGRTTTLGGDEIVVDPKSVDWTTYPPPAAVKDVLDFSSDILIEVVNASIDKLQAEIAEAERKRAEEEAERERQRAADEEGKVKEPYLPIIIVEPKADEPLDADDGRSEGKGKGKATDLQLFPSLSNQGLVVLPIRPPKRSKKSALARLLQKLDRGDPDRGESSSAGAKRRLFSRHAAQQESVSLALRDEELFSAWGRRQSVTSSLGVVLPKAVEPELVECVSCLDEFLPGELVKVPCHSYCFECFARLISSATQYEQHWPPKCCLNDIPFSIIRKNILEDDLKATFEERADEWSVPVGQRIYCNQPDCGLWIKPSQIDHDQDSGTCTNGHTICAICHGDLHAGEACPQDRDLHLTNELAEEEGWKRCHSCHALVEHREACQHMTCRCGAQFCYVCTAPWRTCGCSMDELNRIKEEAARRREARLERERIADEELREMLREIEEFEREEALKQVLLRAEQERREREERRRLELLRRNEVRDKFEWLRHDLRDLAARQRALLSSTHDQDRQTLRDEAVAARDTLAAQQASERDELARIAEERIADKRLEFDTEMAVRVSQEQTLEDRYRAQLEDFYAGQGGDEEAVAASMRAYQRAMDKHFRQWEAHRDAALDEYAERVRDRCTIKEELMYSVRQRMADAHDEGEVAFERRRVAEDEWFVRVEECRAALLESMFAAELDAGDADSLFSADTEETRETDVGVAS